jgi:hypothetical protein
LKIEIQLFKLGGYTHIVGIDCTIFTNIRVFALAFSIDSCAVFPAVVEAESVTTVIGASKLRLFSDSLTHWASVCSSISISVVNAVFN